MGARVVLCGMIEAYSMDTPPPGPWLGPVVGARASLKGLVVYDHAHWMPELVRVVGAWMRGENFGKALVRVGPETL